VSQADAIFGGVQEQALLDVLTRFTGTQTQIPPMYSALKRDGKPLYEYARAGIELEREPRTITIYSLELLALAADGMTAEVEVACSKGTYIRTLAQDIGRALGCFGHLSALRRTRVGPFSLDRAVTLEALQAMPDPKQALLAMNELPAGLQPAT